MRGFLWVLVAIVAAGSFSSLLSPLYWGFDLINHLRPQAMVVSLVVLVVAAFCGRRMIFAAGAVLAGNAVLFALPLAQALNSPAPSRATAQTVRILSANVLTANRQHGRVLDLIRETQPDIVLLTEVNRRRVEALRPLWTDYPHEFLHPRPDNFGMAVYAKLPFAERLISNPGIRVPMAVLNFDGFSVVNAHPVPPIGAEWRRANIAYLEEVARQVDAIDQSVIVAGDLNTTIWGDAMRPLRQAGLRPLGASGIGYTWPIGNPLLGMQIDHILGRDLTTTSFDVLPDIGSDHFPIIADVYVQ